MPIRLSDEPTPDFGLQRAEKMRRDQAFSASRIHPGHTQIHVQKMAGSGRKETQAEHQ